jgi:hypothetical protein
MNPGNAHILPDSRLTHHPTFGSQMVDWPMPDGTTVRCECVMVYCANCGKEFGYVPKDNTSFAFWLCAKCFETHGAIAGTYAQPDDEFCKSVQEEMRKKFGRDLTGEELLALQECGKLGKALELLEKESPFPVPS